MNLEALYNAVVVKPTKFEQDTKSSIIVPDMGKELNQTAKVLAVGDGYYSPTGQLIPTQLKVGDMVVLPTMGFTRFELDGEELWVGKENEILARLGKKRNKKTEKQLLNE